MNGNKNGKWDRRSFASFRRKFTDKEKLAIANEHLKAIYQLMNRRKKRK